ALGLAWAASWYAWFRDSPREKPGVPASELEETAANEAPAHDRFPWRAAMRSPDVRAMLVMAFCYVYVYTFFQTWFHTFLVKGRGFGESSLVFSALPYVVAACANLSGGAASDALVGRFGRRWGRRSIGIAGLGAAGAFTIAAMVTRQPILT